MSLRKAIREVGESEATIWMLPYVALMMILMIFFAALYGFSSMGTVGYEQALAMVESGEKTEQKTQTGREVMMAAELAKFIDRNGLSSVAGVSISPLWIKLELSSPILFDSGSADLKTEAWPLLQAFVNFQKNLCNPVIVEGHTDNVPIHGGRFRSNWELSAARAFSVLQFFVNEGIAPGRLAAHGYGEFRPKFSNETEEGRGRNRRIEITIPRGEYRL